jgi:SAM-dependent methyltransferase
VFNATCWKRLKFDPLQQSADTLLPLFGAERRLAFKRLALRKGERLLVLGADACADLRYVPDAARGIVAEIGPSAAAGESPHDGFENRALDPHQLELEDESFDAVALHRVLELVADPAKCLAEAARVVRQGGRISVLDSFLPRGFRPPLWHRVKLNQAAVLFASADRSFGEILEQSGSGLETELDEACPPPSPNRAILLRKPATISASMPRMRGDLLRPLEAALPA